MNEQVLFVDDEVNVLRAYKRALRKQFRLHTAASGREALEKLDEGNRFAVIVSDMRMPEMDGVTLLARFHQLSPDTVRIMLTGNSDQETAVKAVNEGDIFRFLNKPCPPEKLAEAIQAGLQQHRLITAERELLEQTVRGSLNALSETLALLSPAEFGASEEMARTLRGLMETLERPAQWWLEPLARLCRIGWVALPEPVRRKVSNGDALNEEEEQLFRRYPEAGAELLARIPRLEQLAESIRYQEKHYDGGGFPADDIKGDAIPFGARLLKVALDFHRALAEQPDRREALARLHWRRERYDPDILAALESLLQSPGDEEVMEIDVTALADGMVLQGDINTADGRLLVRKGQRVTPTVRRLIYNFWESRNLRLPLLVSHGDQGDAVSNPSMMGQPQPL